MNKQVHRILERRDILREMYSDTLDMDSSFDVTVRSMDAKGLSPLTSTMGWILRGMGFR